MGRKRRAPVIPVLIYVFAFAALCLSWQPAHEMVELPLPLFAKMQVQLSDGRHEADSRTLKAQLISSDIPMLAYFTKLEQADFRGSSCNDVILQWAEQNPQVHVVCSVPLPDGSTVDTDSTEADLSRCGHGDMEALKKALAYLPELKSVKLGQVDSGDDGLTLADMRELGALLPGAEFDFTVSLLGREVDPRSEVLDLSSLTAQETDNAAAVMACMKNLKKVTLDDNCSLRPEELKKLCDACPEAEFDCTLELYGREVELSATESLDLSHQEIPDGGEALAAVLPLMKKCRSVDLDSTGLSYETLEKLRQDNPHVDIIFRVWFGENYSVRTDAERVLASKPSVGGMIGPDSSWVLKYCTKIKYLDLGHNDELTDIDFVATMPELEVLIIAMTGVTDLSPLSNCPKLEYLEVNSCPNVTDISVLESCPELRHLNIGSCPNISDITALYDIPLQRLWIGCETPVMPDQVIEFEKRQSGCNVNTTTVDPHGEAWRFYQYDPEEPKYYWVPRHELLREQMGYNYQEYSFYWLDPKCGRAAPAEYAGQFGKEVYGLS